MPGCPDPREVVARSYDCIAERYAAWARDEVDDAVAPAYLRLLIERVPRGAAVLDLGCGGGERLARLAEHFEITALDISREQVRRARQAAPRARVLLGDMTRLDFPAASFDAVTAFYAFTHLPHGELPPLLGRIARWLRPGGLLVASMGAQLNPGEFVQDWLGAPTYFSGYDASSNRRFLEQAGLHLLSAGEETIHERLEGRSTPATFFWVVAQRPEAVTPPAETGRV